MCLVCNHPTDYSRPLTRKIFSRTPQTLKIPHIYQLVGTTRLYRNEALTTYKKLTFLLTGDNGNLKPNKGRVAMPLIMQYFIVFKAFTKF